MGPFPIHFGHETVWGNIYVNVGILCFIIAAILAFGTAIFDRSPDGEEIVTMVVVGLLGGLIWPAVFTVLFFVLLGKVLRKTAQSSLKKRNQKARNRAAIEEKNKPWSKEKVRRVERELDMLEPLELGEYNEEFRYYADGYRSGPNDRHSRGRR